jgi:hypothetical protein
MLERQREGIAKAAEEDKYGGCAPAPRRPMCCCWKRRTRHATRSRPTWELVASVYRILAEAQVTGSRTA